MKANELSVIIAALDSVKVAFQNFACEGYYIRENWKDPELRRMYYQLNDMCVKLYEMMEAAVNAAPVEKFDERSEH